MATQKKFKTMRERDEYHAKQKKQQQKGSGSFFSRKSTPKKNASGPRMHFKTMTEFKNWRKRNPDDDVSNVYVGIGKESMAEYEETVRKLTAAPTRAQIKRAEKWAYIRPLLAWLVIVPGGFGIACWAMPGIITEQMYLEEGFWWFYQIWQAFWTAFSAMFFGYSTVSFKITDSLLSPSGAFAMRNAADLDYLADIMANKINSR